LKKVSFPVFPLRDKPIQVDTVHLFKKDERIYLVDDTSIAGDTLGKRRLQLRTLVKDNIRMYRLHNAIYFLGDLVKMTKATSWYIDSSGLIFPYTKTRVVPLIFKPIEKIIPIKTGGAILEIKGISTRFKCLYKPTTEQYAGLLKLSSMEYILYGVYNERHKDTRRKI